MDDLPDKLCVRRINSTQWELIQPSAAAAVAAVLQGTGTIKSVCMCVCVSAVVSQLFV